MVSKAIFPLNRAHVHYQTIVFPIRRLYPIDPWDTLNVLTLNLKINTTKGACSLYVEHDGSLRIELNGSVYI